VPVNIAKRAIPLGLSALILLISLARLAMAFDSLPAIVASHFDASGRADGFQGKTTFVVTVTLISAWIFGMFVLTPSFLRNSPNALINVPDRAWWLAPERRSETLLRLTEFLDWFGVATMALMAATYELILRANLRASPLGPGVWVSLALYLLFTVAWLFAFRRAFRRLRA
jgi:uncharacterized membrane protein